MTSILTLPSQARMSIGIVLHCLFDAASDPHHPSHFQIDSEEAFERQANGSPQAPETGTASTASMLHRRALARTQPPSASPRRSLLPPGSAGDSQAQVPFSSASQFRTFDDDQLQPEGGVNAVGHQAFPPMQMGEIMLEEVCAFPTCFASHCPSVFLRCEIKCVLSYYTNGLRLSVPRGRLSMYWARPTIGNLMPSAWPR